MASDKRPGADEKVLGRNGEHRPAHPIIQREVQKVAVEWTGNGWESFHDIADAAAICVEELITAEDVPAERGRHWSMRKA